MLFFKLLEFGRAYDLDDERCRLDVIQNQELQFIKDNTIAY